MEDVELTMTEEVLEMTWGGEHVRVNIRAEVEFWFDRVGTFLLCQVILLPWNCRYESTNSHRPIDTLKERSLMT